MTPKPVFSRRLCMTSVLGAAALAATGCQPADHTLDLYDTDAQFASYVKLLGSLNGGTIYTSFQGTLSGVVPDQAPLPICRYQGLARSDWTAKPDGTFSKRSFDIGFFADVETGDVIDEVVNPLTGETVQPLHFKYGGGARRDITPDVLTEISWRDTGDKIWLSEQGGGAFPHPMDMATWPRESSGDELYYRSETDYVTDRSQLADPSVVNAEQTLFWSSLLSWEPWLLMGQAPGFTMWRGVGVKLRGPHQIPQAMKDYVARVQPNYLDTGPPWDEREGSFDRFMSLREPS